MSQTSEYCTVVNACLIMVSYVSIMSEYAPVYLNVPQYCSMALSMPQYSYNNIIIIVTNVMLEFLSPQFIHPVALLPFYTTRVRQ